MTGLSLRRSQLGLITLILASTLSACGVTPYEQADRITPIAVKLAEPGWDGEVIPFGQQCKKYHGNGHSPRIEISQIPADSEAVIIEFSDRSWFPMNHGGHGKIAMWLEPGQTSVTFPNLDAESFVLADKHLFLFHPHRGGRGKAGAYLPPCSGGRGNQYFADVKAVKYVNVDKQTAVLLGEASLFLGKY